MPSEKNDANLFYETLKWICDKFEKLNIDYMITGGSAVGFWGHIRTTMDIDIVVNIVKDKTDALIDNIKKEAYIDEQDIKESIEKSTMFQILNNKTYFKIDIIPLILQDEYEKQKFKNRLKINFSGKDIYVISPEDLIISKLIWSKSSGGSERQIRDCESIYKLNKENIKKEYLQIWIKELNLLEEFDKIKN